MTPSDKLREISDRHLRSELNTERLTPLQWEGIMRTIENVISEHYYPLEFVEWLIKDQEIFFGELNEEYILNDNIHVDGRKLQTIDELFNYWANNEK